ncbi:enoyl-CoA hydratase-related protein [Aurantiacibacter odishensis]|uniref:enoyl-CoA hydratase-related protein n=1 Tax=Aurantiacibacter odishensis TaxID=1155476 RepID=UPI000E7078EF|nr:enoyl-CoA hydratase-related protein [Aurantiacibacter odishensis]
MDHGLVKFEIVDSVAILTLSDPRTRNALSWEMADAMRAALGKLGNARSLLICADGKGFCSGGDLTMDGAGKSGFGEVLQRGLDEAVNPLMRELADLDVPVVTAVNGAAAGAGASLALSGDFVLVAEDGFFLFAFPKVGLALDAGASWLLPRLTGLARATQALMLAERIHAKQAESWGMIYGVTRSDQLKDEAFALARRLAHGPTVAYAQIRKTLRQAVSLSYEEVLKLETAAQRACGDTHDCQNAIASFRAKKEPEFKGT